MSLLKSYGNKLLFVKGTTLLILLQIIFAKLDLDELFPFINYIDELLALIALLYIIVNFSLFKNRAFKYFVIFYFAFILCGVLSNVYQNIPFLPVWVQIFLDLKFFVIVLLFNQLAYNLYIRTWVVKLFKYILLINIPLIIFQFFYLDLYHSIFDTTGSSGRIDIGGSLFDRAVGIFWHPSQLAIFTCFAIFLFWQLKMKKIWILLACLQLILTIQRYEIVMLVISLSLFSILYPAKKYIQVYPIKVILIIVALFFFSSIFLDFFSDSLNIYFTSNINDIDDPRIIFYMKSFQLASIHFPIGTGFGTFGGYAAFFFDSKVYKDLGFYYYSWYNAGNYMMDTFYPHIIGESGYIGFLFYIIAYIFFFKKLIKHISNCKVKKAYVFLGIYIALSTLGSPAINDSLSIILCAILPFAFNDKEIINLKKHD